MPVRNSGRSYKDENREEQTIYSDLTKRGNLELKGGTFAFPETQMKEGKE